MVEQQVDLSKLAAAIGGNIDNLVGFIAAELADIAITKAPVETGRMVRSINVNDGNNPRLTDNYRSNRVEMNVQALKSKQKRDVFATVRRRMDRRGSNRRGEVWWITAAAPYSINVHDGSAYRQRVKDMPRRRQRAAWANMRDKMAQRGETQYQRKTGEGFNFFSFKPAEVARAAAKAKTKSDDTTVRL